MSTPDPVMQRSVADDEIDLIQLFLVLWKRRRLILLVTLLLTLAGTGAAFLMPEVYEITAIIEPGKDAEGKPLENPQAIRENILGGAYNHKIVEKLKLAQEKLPDIAVTVPKNTDLVKISLESTDPASGVKILDLLLRQVSENMQLRLEVKIDEARNLVQETQLKGQAVVDQITLLDKQLVQTEVKMTELEDSRKAALADRGGDAMAVLLYSSEIQNLQVYVNNLQMQRTDLNSKKAQNSIDIGNAKLKLASIKGTNINKAPTVPEKPVKPKKKQVVALAFVLGLVGGIMLAFVAEFVSRVKQQKVMNED